MTNVQAMSQFVTSLNRTASEVMRTVYAMKLDEEPEDTHRYQPSGFINPLTLPEAKGYPSSRFPNLYGMVTDLELEILQDLHQGIFRVCAPRGHQTSIAPPPLQ